MNVHIQKIIPSQDLTEESSARFADFLYQHLGQFRDPRDDILEALRYSRDRGGWIFTLKVEEQLAGVCVVLDTGMQKFVPRNFLVYIAVDEAFRGRGLGGRMIDAIQKDLGSSISLHVEHDNPAKRLYERAGFTSKYAEMRWSGR